MRARSKGILHMIRLPKLSRTAKLGAGVVFAYTSCEAYMQIQTWNIIRLREKTCLDSQPEETARFSSANVNGIYVNPFREYRPQSVFEFLLVRVVELAESFYANKIEIHDMYPSPEGDFAEVGDLLKSFKPNYALLRENSEWFQECLLKNSFDRLFRGADSGRPINDQLLFTWLGQSCSLIQVGGINILTDPIFSDHLFTPKLGPKRLVKSPMTVEDVKFATKDNLNLVLISHNHPDHLETEIIKDIGNKPTWVVPLGLKKLLNKHGITNIIELDWWEEVSLNDLIYKTCISKPDDYSIVCVPSMHWSGRHVIDANTSLWGSFILRRNKQSLIYHAGDTGYCEKLFETIGSNYSPVFLSMLPIGQYCPSWHQRPRHTSPEEVFKIASSMKSTNLVGIHFGTFKLSSEPILEPKNKFMQLSEKHGMLDRYKVPDFGRTYEFDIPSTERAM